jgi:hypothetical protein
MARVEMAHVNEAPPKLRALDSGARPTGSVRSRAVLGGAERPLWLFVHELAPAAQLVWDRPSHDQVLYVSLGAVRLKGEAVPAGGVAIVEHAAEVAVEAGTEGATLLQFRQADGAPPPERAGGNVHVVADPPPGPAQASSRSVTYADSSCPTCTAWLHESVFTVPSRIGAHEHTEDELIFITRGEMRLGRKSLGPGAALAIDKDTQYGFETGPDGVNFLNYRPIRPSIVWKAPPEERLVELARA